MDIWNIISNSIKIWNKALGFWNNIGNCTLSNLLLITSVLIILIIVIISVCGINWFIKKLNNSNNISRGKIVKARKANKLSSEFLLAYILPMIAFDFGDIQSVILFLIYFVVLAFLCIRNNNIYTNILLEFKGYKMYNCDIECTVLNEAKVYCDSIIISSNDLTLNEGNNVKYWDFENYVYITVKEEN